MAACYNTDTTGKAQAALLQALCCPEMALHGIAKIWPWSDSRHTAMGFPSPIGNNMSSVVQLLELA